MGVDVLQVLRLGAVDVAREVEVKVVLRVGNFRDGHHAGVAWVAFILAGEGVDDLVEVLLAEAVLRAVFLEALRRINHEDTLAGGGVFLVKHKDAGGDAGAVEEIGGQADDGFQVTRADELLADDGLRIAAEEHAVRKNAGAFARAFQRANDVQQECVVALLGRWHSPYESLVGVTLWGQTSSPSLDRERRIGDHVVVGAELFAILELGRGQRVALQDVGRRKIVQDHVHAGETGGGHIHLLPFEGDVFSCFGGDFEQERPRAAGGVVGGGGGDGVGGRDADDLRHDAADFGRGVELALALAALTGEVPHQIFVGVAEDVVVLGAVL